MLLWLADLATQLGNAIGAVVKGMPLDCRKRTGQTESGRAGICPPLASFGSKQLGTVGVRISGGCRRPRLLPICHLALVSRECGIPLVRKAPAIQGLVGRGWRLSLAPSFGMDPYKDLTMDRARSARALLFQQGLRLGAAGVPGALATLSVARFHKASEAGISGEVLAVWREPWKSAGPSPTCLVRVPWRCKFVILQ
jgi:hypothetical protein